MFRGEWDPARQTLYHLTSSQYSRSNPPQSRTLAARIRPKSRPQQNRSLHRMAYRAQLYPRHRSPNSLHPLAHPCKLTQTLLHANVPLLPPPRQLLGSSRRPREQPPPDQPHPRWRGRAHSRSIPSRIGMAIPSTPTLHRALPPPILSALTHRGIPPPHCSSARWLASSSCAENTGNPVSTEGEVEALGGY